ncbi:hypothetical protein BDW74DRAFT_152953 [Aspergillus multicolor]|uniref:uncharacterized protein n=1 Tax=Aspergillus multicolor TaxID=41759 RepID=UPI003CCE1B3F
MALGLFMRLSWAFIIVSLLMLLIRLVRIMTLCGIVGSLPSGCSLSSYLSLCYSFVSIFSSHVPVQLHLFYSLLTKFVLSVLFCNISLVLF